MGREMNPLLFIDLDRLQQASIQRNSFPRPEHIFAFQVLPHIDCQALPGEVSTTVNALNLRLSNSASLTKFMLQI